jgi:hypothetical protein
MMGACSNRICNSFRERRLALDRRLAGQRCFPLLPPFWSWGPDDEEFIDLLPKRGPDAQGLLILSMIDALKMATGLFF